MATENEIIELYKRERQYEKSLHGDYRDVNQLSFPSFIIFLKRYLEKIEESYTENWTEERPEWFLSCKEFKVSGVAPVKAYTELIKLFALAGAALETYMDVDAEKWRQDSCQPEK